MRINKDSLKARANNIAKELNISQNTVYDRFFFDAFLARLAVSKYKDKFVLKGGLYLSSVLGVNTRSTMDIDFYLKQISMEKENIIRTITEIIEMDFNDNVTFQIIGSTNIRPDDLYGGFQVKLLGRLDNVRYEFGIDVATGDPIIPSERNYDYRCLVTGETLAIKTYSLESIIAEKLETVLAKQIANSRSKDYYDLYILRKTQIDNVDEISLKLAFKEACKYRNFSINKEEALSLMDEIGNNSQMKSRWLAYSKRNAYAKDLEFNDAIVSIIEWIKEVIE